MPLAVGPAMRATGGRVLDGGIATLIAAGRLDDRLVDRALGLLRESLDADPAFVPLLPEHGARLAEQARLGGQAQLAVDTLHALFNAHPGEPASAQWGLTAAMILLERFNRTAEAKVLLERARTRTTDEVLLQRIDAALGLHEKLLFILSEHSVKVIGCAKS